MNMKTIAILGHGYVGRAVEQFFNGKFTVVLYDPPQGHADKEAVANADMVVICLPTPMSENGQADVSLVEEAFTWVKSPLILLKSTVPPGTTARLAKEHALEDRLVFSPEFIGEGGYPVPYWEGMPHPTDMKLHQTFIFGGAKAAADAVATLHAAVAGPFARYLTTDSTTAELMKYMENAWIGTKVTFCNEFFEIARAFGVSYTELRELWLTDGRVGRSHTVVNPERRGFGGKCIPKDTAAIYTAAKLRGYASGLLAAVLRQNSFHRGEQIPDAILS